MLARFRLVYKIRISDSCVHRAAGRPEPRFMTAVRDIVALHGIAHGEIICKGLGRHARLIFSDDFPQTGRQAIRNVWTPPTTPGPAGGRRARG